MKYTGLIMLFLFLSYAGLTQNAGSDTIFVFQEDTVLSCNIDSIYLDAGEGYSSYFWTNTGDTTSGIWIYDTDTYVLAADDGSGEIIYDTTYVNIIIARLLGQDTTICYGDTIVLAVEQKRSPCLVAYYPFNGDSKDYSGNEFNGFAFGATLVIDRFGNPRSAYSFNGLNSFILATLGNIQNSFAISLWYRMPDSSNWYPDNGYPTLFDYDNGLIRNYILGKSPSFISGNLVGKHRFDHYVSGAPSENFYFDSDFKPEFEQWHHYYAVYDSGDDPHRIWIDGEPAGTFPGNSPLNPVDNLIFFGRADSINRDSSYFVGRMDEISIYNCALNDEEIEAVYNSGTIYNYSYSWSTGDSLPAISEVPENDTNIYYVTVSDGINSCTDSVIVYVNPEIKLDLEQIDIGCPGEEKAKVQAFVSGGTGPYTIEWDPRILFLQGDTLALGLKDSTEYSISVTDSAKCVLEDSFEVDALPLPEVEFEYQPEEVYYQNPVVTFTGQADSAFSWLWDFGDGATSIEQSPVHVFSSVDEYIVTLIVQAYNSCIDSTSQTIDIKEVELTIPNVFTPNGDGINDDFVVVDLDKYITNRLVVFNRWGKRVFEKNDYQSGDWDGDNLADGTYFYVLRCTGYFSEDEFKGTVNVFRGSR